MAALSTSKCLVESKNFRFLSLRTECLTLVSPRFERELTALRQEIAQSSQSQSAASTSSPPTPAPSSPKVVPSENSEDFNDDYGRLDYAQANEDETITNDMNPSLMLPRIFVTESDSAASSPREQVFSEQEESKDK